MLRLLDPMFWLGVVIAIAVGFASGYIEARGKYKGELDSYVEDVAAERKNWIDKMSSMEKHVADVSAVIKDYYEAALSATNRQRDDALRRLRQQSEAAALKPAADAPVACREYEAPPSRLSQQDGEFLIRLAAEADTVVAERNACIDQYEQVRKTLQQYAGDWDVR